VKNTLYADDYYSILRREYIRCDIKKNWSMNKNNEAIYRKLK
jgi:hypothetical protein